MDSNTIEVVEEEEDADDSIIPPASLSATAHKKEEPQLPSAAPLWQTKVRQGISPYLPPPVIQAMQIADLALAPYMGGRPEGCVTVVSTLLAAWVVLAFLRRVIWSSSRIMVGSGRALADGQDDDDAILSSSAVASTKKVDATVLLVGPSLGGKTRLFYRLAYGEEYGNMPTLMSLKANVATAMPSSAEEEDDDDDVKNKKNNSPVICYMDWPGYAPLTDSALKSFLVPTTRIVLVVDASQPVASAADILYQLLQDVAYRHRRTATTRILVACHKTDLSKAKNWRRIKIQIRTELEQLLTVRAAAAAKGDEPLWWPAGEPLNLDDIPGAQIAFLSTSCEGRLSPELLAFCQKGVLPDLT